MKWSPQKRSLAHKSLLFISPILRSTSLSSLGEILDRTNYANCPFITLHQTPAFPEPLTAYCNVCIADFLGYIPRMRTHYGRLTKRRECQKFPPATGSQILQADSLLQMAKLYHFLHIFIHLPFKHLD